MLYEALQPGTYVVAVSGGIDSMALLDMLAKQNDIQLIVAHYDHGIRTDSDLDRQLVAAAAKKYNLPFVYEQGKLGPDVSENTARNARYAFLRKVQKQAKAHAIVTAHHQDDALETAILNILRGTGRKGLSSIADNRQLRRPLLKTTKDELRKYAREQGIVWREDSTNKDTAITRNYVRHVLLPKIGQEGRKKLRDIVTHIAVLNKAIDRDIHIYLHTQPSRQSLDRHSFILLSHNLALEVLAEWLRTHGIKTFDSSLLEAIVTKAKVLPPGKKIDVNAQYSMLVGKETLVLTRR
jgi:tRNA(Ile)-lysidine synthetase-like protein